jgi:hypothetical protein
MLSSEAQVARRSTRQVIADLLARVPVPTEPGVPAGPPAPPAPLTGRTGMRPPSRGSAR